jgi:hypothetical protein
MLLLLLLLLSLAVYYSLSSTLVLSLQQTEWVLCLVIDLNGLTCHVTLIDELTSRPRPHSG